jgi:hypothetical protein
LLYQLSYLGACLPVTGRESVAERDRPDNAAGIRARPGAFPDKMQKSSFVRSRSFLGSTLAAAILVSPAAVALPQATPPPAPAATRTPAVRSPGNAEWAANPSAALVRAAKEKKLVFIEFDGHDCGNCKRMDALLYPAFDFEALLIPMVPVKVNLESPEGKALVSRYGVGETPSILITTPEGRLVFLMQGFLNTPDFYSHIHQNLDAYRHFASKVDNQDVVKRTRIAGSGPKSSARRSRSRTTIRPWRSSSSVSSARPIHSPATTRAWTL